MRIKKFAAYISLITVLLFSGCQNADSGVSDTPEINTEETKTELIPDLEFANDAFILTIDSVANAYRNEDTFIFNYTDGIINLTGWALNPTYSDSLSSIYLKVGDYVAQGTYGIPRPDVAETFGHIECTYSGFNVDLPISELFKEGDSAYDEIEFIGVSHDLKNLFQPAKFKLLYGELPNESEQIPESENVFDENETDIPDDRIILPELEISDEEINVCVELCNERQIGLGKDIVIVPEEESILLSGWALNETFDGALSALYISTGDKIYQADYGAERVDVAGVFGNNECSECGFSVIINVSDLYTDDNNIIDKVEFIGVSSDETHITAASGYSVILQK